MFDQIAPQTLFKLFGKHDVSIINTLSNYFIINKNPFGEKSTAYERKNKNIRYGKNYNNKYFLEHSNKSSNNIFTNLK